LEKLSHGFGMERKEMIGEFYLNTIITSCFTLKLRPLFSCYSVPDDLLKKRLGDLEEEVWYLHAKKMKIEEQISLLNAEKNSILNRLS
jgi:cell division protein FtsB